MPPTMRRSARLAASTLARFTGDIMSSSFLVSAWVCQATLSGSSSIRSAKVLVRRSGVGTFHQTKIAATAWG
jgi:hypothetical protein